MGELRPTSKKPSKKRRFIKSTEFSKPYIKPAKKQDIEKPQLISIKWHNAKPGWCGRLLTQLDLFLMSLVVIPIFLVYAGYYYIEQDLPGVDSLKGKYTPPTVSWFYDADGNTIGEFYNEFRIVTPLSHIPDHVINAFLAAEDAHFFDHPGVDVLAIVRAFIKNRQAGRIVQGGSTITQQVTKSFLLSPVKSYKRKIREILLAYRLEKHLSKEEILFLYLNQVYFGKGAYGIEGAALTYFGKSSDKLSIEEAAFLAGLVRAPSRYSTDFSSARKRQKYVINRMAENGFIDRGDIDELYNRKLLFRERKDPNGTFPYFTEYVRQIIEEKYGADTLYNGGLRVYTTLDPAFQVEAQQSVIRGLSEISKRNKSGSIKIRPKEGFSMDSYDVRTIEKSRLYIARIQYIDNKKNMLTVKTGSIEGVVKYKDLKWAVGGNEIGRVFQKGDLIRVRPVDRSEEGRWSFRLEQDNDLQASLICIDNDTGQIKAMIGGKDFYESKFNRAVQAERQPGSAFKPFVYATAIDMGFTPADIIWDEQVEYEDGGKIWSPQNYDRQYAGPMTLYMALARSRNVAAVRLLEKVGISNVIELARKAGVKSELRPYLSLALGSSEVTLLEMVAAYSVFPNNGIKNEPYVIETISDRYGKTFFVHEQKPKEVIANSTAFIIQTMLRGVVERGTGRRVSALKRPVGGKTGTSNDLADAWFIGFTPEFTTGVWVGKDKREKLGRNESGGKAAAPVFLDFMKEIHKNRPVREFIEPEGVQYAYIDAETGEFAYDDALNKMKVCFREGYLGKSVMSEDTLDTLYNSEMSVLVYRDGKVYALGPEVCDEYGNCYYSEIEMPDPGLPAVDPENYIIE